MYHWLLISSGAYSNCSFMLLMYVQEIFYDTDLDLRLRLEKRERKVMIIA